MADAGGQSPVAVVDAGGESYFPAGADESELPTAEEAASAPAPKQAKQQAKAQRKGKAAPVEDAIPPADPDVTAGEVSGTGDVESLFLDALKEGGQGGGDDAEQADGDESPEDQQGAGSRAQRRFQALSQRARAAEQRNQEWEQWGQQASQGYANMQRQMQQMATEKHQIEMQLADMRARIETMSHYGPKREEDPADRFRRELRDEAAKQVHGEVSAEMEQLRGQLEAIQQQRQAERQEMDRQRKEYESYQRRQRYSAEADEAAAAILMPGFSEEAQGELKSALGAMTVALAYGRRESIPEAAKRLRPILVKYGLAHVRSMQAGKGKQVAQTQRMTSSPGAARAHARGSAVPSREAAQKAGYADELAAMMARDGLIGG